MMNKETYVVPGMKVEFMSICDVITTSGGETGNNAPVIGNGGAGGNLTDSSWGSGEGW